MYMTRCTRKHRVPTSTILTALELERSPILPGFLYRTQRVPRIHPAASPLVDETRPCLLAAPINIQVGEERV